MQRPGDQTVEVELVEDDVVDGADHDVLRPGGPSLGSAIARVPHQVWATAVAALVVGGAGVAVGQVGIERALDARLAATPGLTGSLATPLRTVWTAPGGGLMATSDDVVIHWDPEGAGMLGTDLRDGTTRYRVPGWCQLAPGEGDLADRYGAPGGLAAQVRPGDVLLCLDSTGPGGERPFAVRDGTARVVDPLSGETVRTITMLTGDTWTVVDGDVVSIGLDAERRVAAGRWSLATGEQQWAYHGTEPAPDVDVDGWGSTMGDGTIGLQLGAWTVTLDVDTGAKTLPGAQPPGTPFAGSIDLPGGGSLRYGPSGSGGVRTTVHPPGGGEPVDVDGYVLVPTVDDGSVPDAVLALRPGPTADGETVSLVDLATGDSRWTSGTRGAVGILSGLVLVAGDTGTSALDARTGEPRWTTTSGTASYLGWQLVTDGRRLLTVEGRGADQTVVARDLRTGEPQWSVPAAVTDGSLVPLPDGALLAVGPYEMAVLRP